MGNKFKRFLALFLAVMMVVSYVPTNVFATENGTEETPVVENPAEETPNEETPNEETPVEDTPVEETPVEETPVEETPVEETPDEGEADAQSDEPEAAAEGGDTTTNNVAKVGNTEYATIDEAIAAWTNGTTLTLLSNVTLSDVVTLKSTEHHILNLGTYTMTAAEGKNAFVIQACGTGSAERSAITINADATNPGGINAGKKCIVYYKYADGGISTEDRPIIKINGGVFTGSTSSWGTAGIYTIGTAARKCATLDITGGTFNCSIVGSGKSKLIVSGGTFNYTVSSQGDSTCHRTISGGTFKSFGFMTADDNNTKFVIGTEQGNYNVGTYIDDNGYLVVGGPVVTEPGEKFEASSPNHDDAGFGSYLTYSSAAENDLYYTSVEEALADNNKTTGEVTVYVDELDMTDISYKGTIVVPEGEKITIVTEAGATPAWTVTASEGSVTYADENGNELVKDESGALVEKLTEVATYDELVAALAIGGKIKLTADITVDTKITAIDGTVIDLNDKTLYVNVENSYYNNVTIKNGNIVLGKDDVHVCEGYFLVNAGKTLVLNGVKMTSAEGSIKGYAVFHLKTGANLDLINCELDIGANEYAAGYVVYAGESTATVDITGTTLKADGNGIVHAATAIKNSTVTIKAAEHGINRSGVTITDSTVTISGGTGRGITAQHGDLVITGNSMVNISNMGEATIELRGDKNLTIAETATVKLDAAVNNTTSGTVTGTVKLPPKGNNFTGYTRDNAIWGEVWGNATESFVIKVLDANGNVMGTTSLNNIGGIIDGDVNVTWSLKLDAASNTDEYWTMSWTTAPTIDNQPAKVELWVDGTKVSGGDVVLNGPDNIGVINAAVADANGKILSYQKTLADAVAAAESGATVAILRAGDYTLPEFANKELTFVGVDKANTSITDWVNKGSQGMMGSTVHFKNLTVKGQTENYYGLFHTAGVTYENCNINGLRFLYAPTVSFVGCAFNAEGVEHSFWTYGASNVTVTDCTFIYTDRAVNCYSENGADHELDIAFSDCTFTYAGTAESPEGAVEINSGSVKSIDLTMANCTAPAKGAMWFNSQWDSKKGENTTVKVDGEYVWKPLKGTGTEEDPILITCVEDLIAFRDKVDSKAQDGSTQYAGKYFKLTADLDLAGINWNPIGTMDGDHGSFKGIFDGDGHTIYNLNVQQAGNGLGLFARTAGNAEIKNLNLHNVTVKSTDNSNYVGGLVGNSYASTKITNVHVTGNIDISGRGYIGGISGHGYVVMDNVSVVGTGTISSTFWCAGGILGYGGEGTTDIKNAHVEGITITSAAGGLGAIVGMAEDNNGTQPISGSNLSAKNVEIKTYTGAYGDTYANYALGYLYGGNPTSKLTGNLSVENVNVETSTGAAPTIVDAVATVNGAIYFDLASAVAAGGEVKLLRDVTEEVEITDGKTVVIDLNGKTLNGAIKPSKADLTVKNGSIVNTNSGVSAIEINEGKLTLTDVNITSVRHALRIDGAVEAIIDGGEYRVNATSGTRHAVNVSGAANVTIKDGIFVGPAGTTMDSGSAVNVQTGATVTIEGGNFSGGKNATLGVSGTMTVKGGIFDQDPSAYVPEGYVVETVDAGYSVRELHHLIIVVSPVATMSTTNVTVATMDEAVAYAQANPADSVVYQITGPVELTTGYKHGILDLGKNVVIEGVTADAKLTIVGGGVPDIKGVTFKNITIADEGAYLPTANEFMYQNYIDCTFIGCTFEEGIRVSGNTTLTGCTINAKKADQYALWSDGGKVTMTGSTVIVDDQGYGMVKSDNATEYVLTNNTFEYLNAANKEALNTKGASITATGNKFIDCTEGILPADKTNYAADGTTVITDTELTSGNEIEVNAAKIGDKKYATLAEAFDAAQNGDKVEILSAGTYALTTSGKNITITGAVDGVVFNMGTSKPNLGGANITFNNVTFNWDATTDYKGLQHAGKLTYNDCIINGKVFLYGTSETFNNCTFNQKVADYNVWTYSAKKVAFNECTFNSAGKSVLIYHESASVTNDVTVTDCDFIASAPVEGKAAIEMDSSLTAGINLTIDAATTATGFGTGNVSGNSLWNNKKGNNTDANNDITVVVDGTTVLAPVTFVAKIGETSYTSLQEAFKAATEGCTIEILSDVTISEKWDCRDYATNGSHSQFNEAVTINGNDHTIKFTGAINDSNWNTVFRFEENATVQNLTIDISEATGAQRVISAKKSLTVDGLTIIGSAKYGIIFGEGASAAELAAAEIVIKNSTLTGTKRAISDNEGGKDVKSVVITGNTLNANVYVSASESITFNNNIAKGEVDLRSYAAENVLSVEAKGNTLTAGVKNYIYAKTADAQAEFVTERPAFKVSTKAELDAALDAAEDGDTIILTADIDYGVELLTIDKPITLDLGGKTLTTRWAHGGMWVKNNPTIKNGTIVHASNTAAIKVWNATAFEDLVIDVQGKGDANKTIGGIVLQSGTTTRVGSIKNVTIKGAGLTNGIETYNCGDATENVIGSMENVTIDAKGTGMLISAPCGTATNCSIKGGTNAIELWIKGEYSASLNLVDCDVEGGVFAHDEFSSNPDIVNNGTLRLTVDEATTGADEADVTLTIARAQDGVQGILKTVMDNAQAKVNDTYYATLAEAMAAAQPGDVVTILAGEYTENLNVNKSITVVGETDAEGNNLVTFNGKLNITADGATVKNINVNNGSDTAGYINAKDVTIDGCSVVGGNGFRWCYTSGTVTFKNSTITGSTYGIHFDGNCDGDVVIDNCKITGWTSFASTIEKVTISNTTFLDGNYNLLRFYQNAEVKNCIFPSGNADGYNTDGMRIDAGDGGSGMAGITLTFNNCKTADGTDLEGAFPGSVIATSAVYVDNVKLVREAKIGDVYYETIAEAIAAVGAGDVVIDLVADATLDYNAREAYGTAETTSLTINGNGNTLTLNQKDSDWSSIGMANAVGKLTLKNMTIEKTGYGDTSGEWNTHSIIFSCNVEMKDVTVNNAIAVENGATLNNVTINEANGYYGLWISGNGQTVTVNGGEINATNGGRGIKIADEYVDSPKQVTLNVTDTEFNTAKKAAVLVTSTAGAKVTASNVDITNVAADPVNFVWVDEKRAANFGNVEVTGATKAQEAVETFNIVVKDGDKIVSYFKTLEEAAAQIATDGSDTTIKILQDVEVGSDIEFVYGTGKVTFEADTPVTIKQTALGTDFDFTKQLANNIVIGKNVTFEVYDNSSGIYLYYGPSLELNGTITGGQNWGALYLFQGEHTVTETGKIGTGRTQIGYTTLTVKGKVDTNYLLVEGSTFTADGATVDAGVIYDNNNGGQRWGASTFNITNSSVVNAGTVTLSYADSVLTIDMSSTLNATTITGAGKIVIDAKDYASGAACPITGNASTFAGTLEVINNDNVVASIDEDGNIVLTEIVYVAQVGETKYETLQEAVNAAKANDVITLLADVDADEVIVVKKPLTINANGHTITEDNVACTKYTNSEGKKVVLTTEVDGDTIVVKPAVLSSEEAGETAAYIVGDENNLMTLQAALDAAQAGDVVKLKGDLTVNSTVIIPTDVTLDIEANTLTVKTLIGLAESSIGAITTTTDRAGGKLVVDPDNVVLAKTPYKHSSGRWIIPVWDPSQTAFVFVNADVDHKEFAVDDNTITYKFGQKAASYANKVLWVDGASDNEVKVLVRLEWTDADGNVAYQDFVYGDKHVAAVSGDGYIYTFQMTGYTAMNIDIETLSITAMFLTDSGAAATGATYYAKDVYAAS